MANISKKELVDYYVYLRDVINGRVLNPDGIRLLCEAEQHDPEKIGKRILEAYNKMIAEGVYKKR